MYTGPATGRPVVGRPAEIPMRMLAKNTLLPADLCQALDNINIEELRRNNKHVYLMSSSDVLKIRQGASTRTAVTNDINDVTSNASIQPEGAATRRRVKYFAIGASALILTATISALASYLFSEHWYRDRLVRPWGGGYGYW